MPLSAHIADDTQLVLWGDAALEKRIYTFLKGRGGDFSDAEIIRVDTLDTLDAALDKAGRSCVCLLAVESVTEGVQDFLNELGARVPRVMPVILSDDIAIQKAARELGAMHLCGIEGTALGQLPDVLHLARHTLGLLLAQDVLKSQNEEADKRFKDVADQFADWLWEVDIDLNLTFSSARRRPGRAVVAGTLFTDAFLAEETLRIEDDFAELMRYPRHFHDRDYWSADAYDSRLCWSVSGVPVHNEAGELTGFRGVARDVSAQKASTDQLYFLSNHDALTGLCNRSRLFDELGRSLRLARREKREAALVLIDLDKFSVVNESYGHMIGDKLLIHVSQVLKDCVRTGDFLARTAGDEFTVLMHDVTAADVKERMAHMMTQFKARPLMTEQGSVSIRFSAAVVHYPDVADDPDDVLLQGSYALHEAKAKGRNRIEVYSGAELRPHTPKDQLEWADLMTRRLQEEEDALILHYQPIVHIKNSEGDFKNAGFYEVLVRMHDDDGVACPPHKFLGAAEDFGLVRLLDQQVVLRSIEKLKTAHEAGDKLKLSVNLSGRTFDDDDVRESIIAALEAAKLPDKSLVLEITETALLRDLAQVKDFIKSLRAVGAGFALDDCGGGVSSFNAIRHLEVDYLKIDGDFVRNMHTNAESRTFVEAIQHIAGQKGVITIAEMVENEDIVAALKDLGVVYGQGFYFGAPSAELA